MATEEGIVIKVNTINGTALVQTKKSSACKACASRKSCSAKDGEDMEINANNDIGAKIGNTVIISLKTSFLLKASFLIHIFPILCLLIGAVIGNEAAKFFSFDASDLSAITGILFLFLSFFYIKSKGNKLSQKEDFIPKIIRITKTTI